MACWKMDQKKSMIFLARILEASIDFGDFPASHVWLPEGRCYSINPYVDKRESLLILGIWEYISSWHVGWHMLIFLIGLCKDLVGSGIHDHGMWHTLAAHQTAFAAASCCHCNAQVSLWRAWKTIQLGRSVAGTLSCWELLVKPCVFKQCSCIV